MARIIVNKIEKGKPNMPCEILDAICGTYSPDKYYINTRMDGKNYKRYEQVVSRWQFNCCKWLWKVMGRKYTNIPKNVLRES